MRPDSKTEPPEPTGVADHASHCAQVALALRRGRPKRMGDEGVHPVPGRDPTTSSIDTAKKDQTRSRVHGIQWLNRMLNTGTEYRQCVNNYTENAGCWCAARARVRHAHIPIHSLRCLLDSTGFAASARRNNKTRSATVYKYRLAWHTANNNNKKTRQQRRQ